MRGYDLAPHMTFQRWACMQSCINEALEVIDEQQFLDRTGFTRSEAETLWDHLNKGIDAHPPVTRDDLLHLAACADLAVELVDDWEFNTRVGFDKPDAVALAAELRSLAAT